MNASQLEDLRPWLLTTLEPICEADPTVLSDYIIALLKHNVSQQELKDLCLLQLDDFLDHRKDTGSLSLISVQGNEFKLLFRRVETVPFVTQLFDHLNAPPAAPILKPTPSEPLGLAAPDSRKRQLDPDSSLPHAKLPRSAAHSSPPPPQPIPGYQSGFFSAPTGPSAMRNDRGPNHYRQGGGAPPPQWGMPGGGFPMMQQGLSTPDGLCQDYHFRGFCARGDACPFIHDTQTTPHRRPQPPVAQSGWRPPIPPSGYRPPQFQQPTPRHASTSPDPQAAVIASLPTWPHFDDNGIPSRPYNNRPGHPAAPQASVPRPSAPRPPGPRNGGKVDPRHQSQTTLVVENAPREALTVDNVRQFFDKFGPITEVAVDVPAQRAIVTFVNPDNARTALGSPEAVFGNRFVRVFRQNLSEAAIAAIPPPTPPQPVAPTQESQSVQPGLRNFSRMRPSKKSLWAHWKQLRHQTLPRERPLWLRSGHSRLRQLHYRRLQS
ncbi:hypothetical protein P7C70_g921, partial [Phenoliferia sp. Uapishka_3]